MHRARIDQNDSTRRCDITCAFMQKRLPTALDQADYIVIMAVARVRMPHITGVQESQTQLGVVPKSRPFFILHTLVCTINEFFKSCRILLNQNARPRKCIERSYVIPSILSSSTRYEPT